MNDKLTDEIMDDSRSTCDEPAPHAAIDEIGAWQTDAKQDQAMTPMPEVPDLLAKRVAAQEDTTRQMEHHALEGMRQRLDSLKQEAAANARNDIPFSDKLHNTDEKQRSDGGKFASVEAALAKLSQQVDDQEGLTTAPETITELSETGAAAAAIDSSVEAPWTEDTAEQLTALCEEAGLPTGRSNDEMQFGLDPTSSTNGAHGSYVYLQPDPETDGQQWFENRFEEMSQRLDATLSEKPRDANTDLTPLLTKFEALEARIEAVLEQAPLEASRNSDVATGSNLHDIELCIAEIAGQLEATTTELTRIGSIEEQITEIAKEIAAQRDAAAAAPTTDPGAMFDLAALADLVADKVSAKPVSMAANNGLDDVPGNAAGVSDLSAVMKDFIRERRSEGEHANAVLDTMQQTIIRVLDRMEALEAHGPRAAGATPQAAAPAPSGLPVAPPPVAQSGNSASADQFATPIEAQPTPAGGFNTAEEAASIDRLHRVVGELGGPETKAETSPEPVQQPEAATTDGAGTAQSRADFIKAARQAAAKANQPADPKAGEPVGSDRARFAAAARQAAANANKRMINDDTVSDEIDATHDGFSLDGIGAPLKPAAGGNNRARLLIAAVALVAVGLVATKFMMSTSSNSAREQLQSSRMQQSSSATAGKTVAKQLGSSQPSTPSQLAQGASEIPQGQGDSPGVAAYVQPVAVAPQGDTANANQPVSGGPGSVSRKALPSALVGPLSLRLAAANGDPSAEFQVASRFADGKGVKQDFDEATKWYRRSAGRGFTLAQYRLGTFYERGLGVSKDIQRARVWYQRAAAHDNIKAMHNLAVLAAGSSTGKPDYVTAAQWFTQAAERGLGDSQFNLAILHQNGLGVPQDDAMAYKWFKLAAASGDDEAGRRMAELAKNIGKTKVAQLDGEVRGWLRKPTSKLANDPHFAGQAWQRKNS